MVDGGSRRDRIAASFAALKPFFLQADLDYGMTDLPRPELNDWQTYHVWVDRAVEPGMRALEVGCGRGEVAPFPWEERPDVELIGADVDPSAAENPALRRFVRIVSGRHWDVRPGAVDVVLARYVLEHVEDPDEFLENVRRALKPGGALLFLTPNARHPAMWVSRRLPIGIKRRLLARTGHAAEEDVFPTWYRMNTPGELERLAARHGFLVCDQETREYAPCRYLDFLGGAGKRLACGYRDGIRLLGWESALGAQILGRWRKKA